MPRSERGWGLAVRGFENSSPEPKSKTPNPEPRAPNPEPRTPNPEPRTPSPQFRAEPAAPPVSIVLTSKNRQADLLRAIESCLAQVYPDVEVLLYDASTDDTQAAVGRRFPEVRYIRDIPSRRAGGRAKPGPARGPRQVRVSARRRRLLHRPADVGPGRRAVRARCDDRGHRLAVLRPAQ